MTVSIRELREKAECPSCGRDDPRFTGRYGPVADGSYVCFRCLSSEVEAAAFSFDDREDSQ